MNIKLVHAKFDTPMVRVSDWLNVICDVCHLTVRRRYFVKQHISANIHFTCNSGGHT